MKYFDCGCTYDFQAMKLVVMCPEHNEFQPPDLVPVLPTDTATRNDLPMADGCLDYFPLALAYIAYVSKVANEQHNPGEAMHWARGKSLDHRNKILKHLADCGTQDTDGLRHSGKMAWRALAELQTELEKVGWGKPGRASRFPTTPKEI